jgi:hypothetical protein
VDGDDGWREVESAEPMKLGSGRPRCLAAPSLALSTSPFGIGILAMILKVLLPHQNALCAV